MAQIRLAAFEGADVLPELIGAILPEVGRDASGGGGGAGGGNRTPDIQLGKRTFYL